MDSTIDVQGKQLKLSNLDKVLYPATGFTKQQIIDYYVRIWPAARSRASAIPTEWMKSFSTKRMRPSTAPTG
jgi:DNA primase